MTLTREEMNTIEDTMGVRDTLITNSLNENRPYLEEAIERYEGPAKIELRDKAYDLQGGLLPSCFSVHVVNDPQNGRHELGPFWQIFYQIRVEHGQPGDPMRKGKGVC